ncbi:MAG: FKBP-type peptidyl-prolyl cis-trans isomerase [Armatimonadota bacterium]
MVTKSGLKYKDIKVGTGFEVKVGDSVTVHYKGWLDDGTVFDTSKKPGGQPFAFPVGGGQVIKGWDEGLQGMKKGGVRELVIPPDLGYGSDDMGTIPPNSTLHFQVDLLMIGGND